MSDLDTDDSSILWTYDELSKGPKIRSCEDEPIFDAFKSFAKTSRGKCRVCGDNIEKGTERLGLPALWVSELDDSGKPKRKEPKNGCYLQYMHLACAINNCERVHEEDPFLENIETPSPKKKKEPKKKLIMRSFAEMMQGDDDEWSKMY